MESYKELIVWQKSMSLVNEIYKLTQDFPQEERFGLTNQMRRSAVSIPSNIAEGWGRSTTGNYLQFLRVSKGSLYELETQLAIASSLNFTPNISKSQSLIIEIGKMLNTLIKKLEQKSPKP